MSSAIELAHFGNPKWPTLDGDCLGTLERGEIVTDETTRFVGVRLT